MSKIDRILLLHTWNVTWKYWKSNIRLIIQSTYLGFRVGTSARKWSEYVPVSVHPICLVHDQSMNTHYYSEDHRVLNHLWYSMFSALMNDVTIIPGYWATFVPGPVTQKSAVSRCQPQGKKICQSANKRNMRMRSIITQCTPIDGSIWWAEKLDNKLFICTFSDERTGEIYLNNFWPTVLKIFGHKVDIFLQHWHLTIKNTDH